ncbi:MAG: hypothetical protein AAGA38_02965 [Pseudomonadota bacterium]
MTKVAGVAASYAPMLGTVGSALTSGAAALMLGSALTAVQAVAGSCNFVSGTFICSSPADPGDVTQNLSPSGDLTVVTTEDFGIDTSATGGNAFSLGNSANTTSINLQELYGAAITAANYGISAIILGPTPGDLSLMTTGTIQGLGDYGILAQQYAPGATTISNTNAAGTASVTGNRTWAAYEIAEGCATY